MKMKKCKQDAIGNRTQRVSIATLNQLLKTASKKEVVMQDKGCALFLFFLIFAAKRKTMEDKFNRIYDATNEELAGMLTMENILYDTTYAEARELLAEAARRLKIKHN